MAPRPLGPTRLPFASPAPSRPGPRARPPLLCPFLLLRRRDAGPAPCLPPSSCCLPAPRLRSLRRV
eukprot:1980165-Lingulodinium_polyedra.AAC.1